MNNNKINRAKDFDFWTEAGKFVQTLVDDVVVRDAFYDYAIENNLNHPEILLFKELAADQFKLHMTMAQFKIHRKNEEEE